VLREAAVPVTMYGGKDTNHSKLNDDLGLPGDPATPVLYDFVEKALK
jgi:arylformamidase